MRLLLVFALAFALHAQSEADFEFVIVPDQHPPSTLPYPAFQAIVDWVAANKVSRNIRGVFSTGDFVSGSQSVSAQLANVWTVWTGITSLGLPWLIAPGNHDYNIQQPANRLTTVFDAQLGYIRTKDQSWFVAADPTALVNQAIRFQVGYHKFLVIALEYYPRADKLTWAANLVDAVEAAYGDHFIIWVTHGYLDVNGNRCVDGAAYCSDGDDSSGQEQWDGLYKLERNSLHVFSGHFIGGGAAKRHARRLSDVGVNGNPIYQFMTNYQEEPVVGDPETGGGWALLVTFQPSTSKIRITNYKTYNCDPATDPDQCLSTYWPPYEVDYTPPAITSTTLAGISPDTIPAGASRTITLSGGGFTPELSISAPAGVTVSNIAVVSDAEATATFTASVEAELTSGNVTATTPLGGTSGAQTLSIGALPVVRTLGGEVRLGGGVQ